MATTAAELRQLTATELAERLGEARQELFNLRFQLATRKLENHNRLGEVRRQIARILTIAGQQGQG
ncbi:MAG: 50S ribosomal protein L29 [Chloroflexi bacterium]|nr:50S ribosomal protein L29 [Chloroflexota bacterium]